MENSNLNIYKKRLNEMAISLGQEILSKMTLMKSRSRNEFVKEKQLEITDALSQVVRFTQSISVAKPSKKSLKIFKSHYDEILDFINNISPENKINKPLFLGLDIEERYMYVINRGDYISSINRRGFLIKLYNIDKTYIEIYYSIIADEIRLKKVEILESNDKKLNLYVKDVNISSVYL